VAFFISWRVYPWIHYLGGLAYWGSPRKDWSIWLANGKLPWLEKVWSILLVEPAASVSLVAGVINDRTGLADEAILVMPTRSKHCIGIYPNFLEHRARLSQDLLDRLTKIHLQPFAARDL
jgi:hypothetical protein